MLVSLACCEVFSQHNHFEYSRIRNQDSAAMKQILFRQGKNEDDVRMFSARQKLWRFVGCQNLIVLVGSGCIFSWNVPCFSYHISEHELYKNFSWIPAYVLTHLTLFPDVNKKNTALLFWRKLLTYRQYGTLYFCDSSEQRWPVRGPHSEPVHGGECLQRQGYQDQTPGE